MKEKRIIILVVGMGGKVKEVGSLENWEEGTCVAVWRPPTPVKSQLNTPS